MVGVLVGWAGGVWVWTYLKATKEGLKCYWVGGDLPYSTELEG